ncbi:MAG: RNA polymerase sigma factor [Bacteroidota bacterium]
MSLKNYKSEVLSHKNKLYRFALRIVGNVAEAEDVVQEVLIKMWKSRSQLGQFQNTEAWCMKMTKNLSIDKLRSKHRQTSTLPEAYELSARTASPYQQAEMGDTVSHIRTLMEALPDKQRMTMQLRDIEGMSYKEIAEVLDIPLNQVKVNLFRARQYIRTQLINKESYGL